MTEPRYSQGWSTEAEFRALNLEAGVHYRSVMRLVDGKVWCAPMGTLDPWPADEADEWADITGQTS